MGPAIPLDAAFTLRNKRLVIWIGALPDDSVVFPIVSRSVVATAGTQGCLRLWCILVPTTDRCAYLGLRYPGRVNGISHYSNLETHVFVMGCVRFLFRRVTVSKPYEGGQIFTAIIEVIFDYELLLLY